MSLHRRLSAVAVAAVALLAATGFDAVSSKGVDLSGNWQLNPALSDDAEHMLEERQRRERELYMKWRKQEERMYPPGAPPIDVDSPGAQRSHEPSSARRASMKRHQEDLYRMLAISDTLAIRQEGSSIDIVSAVESRRVVAGSRTQVSLPEGQLADSKVGWDGQWFVIQRVVRGGPHVTEKYRLMPKTAQLEYQMTWSGDSEIGNMKIKRVFDRVTQAPPPGDPAAGPIR